jgi:hypothetical protein
MVDGAVSRFVRGRGIACRSSGVSCVGTTRIASITAIDRMACIVIDHMACIVVETRIWSAIGFRVVGGASGEDRQQQDLNNQNFHRSLPFFIDR